MNAAVLQARPGRPLKGRVRAPGDKSISHRALILAAMAEGETVIEGLLEGDDVLRTAAAMRAFGAEVERTGPGAWRVVGKGRLEEPTDVVDCGNSGTGVRLIMGAVAGYPIAATFTGDQSLRGRPMARITDPLKAMGATTLGRSKGRLPLTLQGGELKTSEYHPPMASAQVKSAVLLAGLNAPSGVTVVEKESTRDHTERMMRAFGAEVTTTLHGLGRTIVIKGGQALRGTVIRVPSDPSSAAFPLVGALITPGSEVVAEGVLLNPLRAGLFQTLQEMGADLTIENRREESGEPIGDLRARYSPEMRGVEVPAERAPSMIDEYPILAIAAAFAEGRTVMKGVGELRVKESDRLALTAGGLEACGVTVEEEPEGLIVTGARRANHPVRGGSLVETHGDHRIAMAHLVLGLGAEQPVRVDEAGMIATSFPGFRELMAGLGADISEA